MVKKVSINNKSNRYFFIILGILYVLYASAFILGRWFMASGKGILLHILFFLFPCYIFTLWKVRNKLVPLDYCTVYIPLLFWIIFINAVGGKSEGQFLVELAIVGILSGIYLLKIPVVEYFKIKKHWKISFILWFIIFILIVFFHYII